MEETESSSPPPGMESRSGSQAQHLPKVQPFQEAFIAAPPPQDQAPRPTASRRTTRSRASSTARPGIPQAQPQPIRDAVDQAFSTQATPADTQLDQAFIAQVTEAVIRNLQSANIGRQTSTTSQQAASPPPGPTVQSVPNSPTLSSRASFPPAYTPPSPQAARREADGFASVSPEPVLSDVDSTYSRLEESDRDGDTPKPLAGEKPPLRRSTSSRRRVHNVNQSRRRGSLSDSTGSHSTYRRDSQESAASSGKLDASRPRTRPTSMMSPLEEPTTLEKIWQPLFDNGNPTVRLSQFLRGLAVHIIDEYEPKCSLVVTPAKMQRFFDETKLPIEVYPWQTVFGGAMTNEAIGIMYRRLLCQHHLVQAQNHETPSVPGLTPFGFEWLLTCLIQAHPSLEYERLSKAVMNMPISNADDMSERFPKELSRRLLPSLANPLAEQRIIASMAHEAALLQLRNASAMPPPPSSAPPMRQSIPERQRNPYSRRSFSNSMDDEDSMDSSVASLPVERERKPYTSKEGRGKTYDMESDLYEQDRSTASRHWPVESCAPLPRPIRQNSIPPLQSNGPAQSSSRHRMSMGSGVPIQNLQGSSRPRSRRSPPPTNAFARSDPTHLNDIPSNQFGSNLSYPRGPGPDPAYLDRASVNEDHQRSSNASHDELDPRGKPIPPRNRPPSVGHDSTYSPINTAGLHNPQSRPPPTHNRRRSMYNPAPPNPSASAGGSDGYGSFASSTPQFGYGSSGSH